ncbi:MAG: polysaccharide deacetylase family protein [Bacteroidales bacterium]
MRISTVIIMNCMETGECDENLQAPYLFRLLYPGAIFRVANNDKKVYLTFDDGPTPGVTEQVLSILEETGVKATFFCTGRRAENSRDLFEQIGIRGFATANHGYDHLKGWGRGKRVYIKNVSEGAEQTGSKLFRPPYGSVTPGQFRSLKNRFTIVFWDIILYDFDATFSPGQILRVAQKKLRPGSIIVLHDSSKSSCLRFLPDLIKLVRKEGYTFGDLSVDLK